MPRPALRRPAHRMAAPVGAEERTKEPGRSDQSAPPGSQPKRLPQASIGGAVAGPLRPWAHRPLDISPGQRELHEEAGRLGRAHRVAAQRRRLRRRPRFLAGRRAAGPRPASTRPACCAGLRHRGSQVMTTTRRARSHVDHRQTTPCMQGKRRRTRGSASAVSPSSCAPPATSSCASPSVPEPILLKDSSSEPSATSRSRSRRGRIIRPAIRLRPCTPACAPAPTAPTTCGRPPCFSARTSSRCKAAAKGAPARGEAARPARRRCPAPNCVRRARAQARAPRPRPLRSVRPAQTLGHPGHRKSKAAGRPDRQQRIRERRTCALLAPAAPRLAGARASAPAAGAPSILRRFTTGSVARPLVAPPAANACKVGKRALGVWHKRGGAASEVARRMVQANAERASRPSAPGSPGLLRGNVASESSDVAGESGPPSPPPLMGAPPSLWPSASSRHPGSGPPPCAPSLSTPMSSTSATAPPPAASPVAPAKTSPPRTAPASPLLSSCSLKLLNRPPRPL